ncbi:MAG: DUF58 domain-containing protein [Bryobacterales bacterium]|jgi:uncharacterized protein (DUF58 family)|nr:DUF58 domain-containing protein [Bryobacterales bacterium]
MKPQPQRFLDPQVLAGISTLDLVARTVVDGFVSGLHRSPDFGFSQEFAEYRPYTPGDDPRHIDWNVFSRTERTYLKRYHGETNTLLTILLDASASMRYSTTTLSKLDYARFLAASLAYLANQQRDAFGLLVFDEGVREYIPASARFGQLPKLLHAMDRASEGAQTDFETPLLHFRQFVRRRGIVAILSDFYTDPTALVKLVEPIRYRGNDVVLFHILDPREINPNFKDIQVFVDMETERKLEVSPEYLRGPYMRRMQGHLDAVSAECRRTGIDYMLMPSDKPLDAGLREYLTIRQGRL